MKYLVLEEVDSTNSYVALHAPELEDMTMVIADMQTAGRGQRGNSWESEPGKNLTFTLLHRPQGVPARKQFSISEAAALAVRDVLADYGVEAKVKWPNDVYVDNRKISGILIEHSLQGAEIEHSRIGVGLNVNQAEFLSDAPNPVSLKMLTGEDIDLNNCAARVYAAMQSRLAMAATETGRTEQHAEFLKTLWRGDSRLYPFRDKNTGLTFMGAITDVEPEGLIHIRPEGSQNDNVYAFKQVEYELMG